MVLDTDSSIFSVFVMFNLYCRFVYIVQVFVHLFAALFYLLAIQGIRTRVPLILWDNCGRLASVLAVTVVLRAAVTLFHHFDRRSASTRVHIVTCDKGYLLSFK